MSTALQALRQDRTTHQKMIDAIDIAIAALESVNGGAPQETISLAPSTKVKRARKARKAQAPAQAPKPKVAKEQAARRPRITTEKALQIVSDVLAAGPSTLRDIEAILSTTDTPMAYPAINRSIKTLVDSGAVVPVGDNKRNTQYALSGPVLVAADPEDESQDDVLADEPDEGDDEGDEEEDLVLAEAEQDEAEEAPTQSESYSF